MAKVTINKVKVIYRSIPGIETVEFDYLGKKVYSAEKIERMLGVFVSQPIMGGSSLVGWKELSVTVQKPQGTDVYIYLKASSTEDGLDTAIWTGPYLNDVNDISVIKDQWMQFIVILVNNGATGYNYEHIKVAETPILQNLELSYFSSENAVKFYTRAFDLGFVPKHVLLTYNGDISSESIVRFAISGFDSIDANDYQYIDPNKIEQLSDLSLLSNKIKVMIEMIGESGITLTIHEFALMFSGDAQLRLNDISSSSSESSSSSSSSIDSSSSSSSLSSSSSSSMSSESSSSSSISSLSSSSSSLSSESSSSSSKDSSSSSSSLSSSSSSVDSSSSSSSSSSMSSLSSSSSSSLSSSSSSISSESSSSSSSESSSSSSSLSSSSSSVDSSSSSSSLSSSSSSMDSSSSSSSLSSESSSSSSSISSMSSSSSSSISSLSSSSSSLSSLSSSSSSISSISSSSSSSLSSESSSSSSSSSLSSESSSSISFSSSSSSGIDLTSIQMVHLKMNDNASNTSVVNDGSASITFASIRDTDVISVAGKINTALEFDSDNSDHLVAGYDADLDTDEGSFALWVFLDTDQPDYAINFADDYMVPSNYFALRTTTTQIILGEGIGSALIFDTTVLADSAWHHVVAIQNGSVAKIYVDGVELTGASQDDLGGNWISAATYTNLQIATYRIDWGFYDGKIDDLRIFNRALTEVEIDFLYNGGSGTEANKT